MVAKTRDANNAEFMLRLSFGVWFRRKFLPRRKDSSTLK